MKFRVKRTTSILGDAKPCLEAYSTEDTYLDWRTFKTLAEARLKLGGDYFNAGTNHREENGMVVRDLEKQKIWAIDINSLTELLKFYNKYGDLIICESDYKNHPLTLEIYDDYRE